MISFRQSHHTSERCPSTNCAQRLLVLFQLFVASENFLFAKQSHFNSRSVAGTSKQVGQPREVQRIKSKINSNPTVEETQGILQREDSPVLRLIHHPVQPK